MECLQVVQGWYSQQSSIHKQRGYHWYAFTINPSDHKGNDPELRIRVHRFNRYKSFVNAFYIRQISAAGMLHYHGIIQMKDTCKFKKLFKDKKYHYLLKSLNTNNNGWYKYLNTDKPKQYFTIQREHPIFRYNMDGTLSPTFRV